MKIIKALLPVILLFFLFLGIGCHQEERSAVKKAINGELALLKNLDSDTAMKYVSYKEIFPATTETIQLSDEIKEVFSLFFQNFNYRVLDINVDQKTEEATATVRLKTLDAKALARDFATTSLLNAIMEAAADSSVSSEDINFSLEDRYLLLNTLLTENKYDSVERNCSMNLQRKDGIWEINRTYSLENDLVGGLITYLSDPDLLSPQETLSVYFDALKSMNVEEMSHYLGLSDILNTTDSERNAIALALAEQVHTNFDYEIVEASIDGYLAEISTLITSFDSDDILNTYQKKAEEYLASPDAVIDGASTRYTNLLNLLTECIASNTQTISTEAVFQLVNDGASWKLRNGNLELGNAIFGNLTESPVSEE